MLTLGVAMAHIARVMGDQVHAATEQERNASLPAGFGLFLFAFLALEGYACWRLLGSADDLHRPLATAPAVTAGPASGAGERVEVNPGGYHGLQSAQSSVAERCGLAEDLASDLTDPGEDTPVRAPHEAYPRTALFFSIATSTSSEGDAYHPLADGPAPTFLEEVLTAAEREQKRKIELRWSKLATCAILPAGRMQVRHGRRWQWRMPSPASDQADGP